MFGFRKIYSEMTHTKCIRHSSQKSKFNSKFKIVQITPQHYDAVLRLFRYSYLNGEPLLVASELSYKSNPFLESRVLKFLSRGISLMALCRQTGNVVGAAVNNGICPWEPEKADKAAQKLTCPKTAQVVQFMAYVMRTGNHWKKFNEHQIFEIAFLMTDQANERMGIASNLLKKSITLGQDLTYNVITIHATNYFVQQTCRKCGMNLVAEIPYKSYVDCNGKPLLHPPPPHNSVQVYVSLPHAMGTTNKQK